MKVPEDVHADEESGHGAAHVRRVRHGVVTVPSAGVSVAWLPDGNSQIFGSYAFGPFFLKDYGSATLRCKI